MQANEFPVEIWIHILGNLELDSIRFATVSKTFYDHIVFKCPTDLSDFILNRSNYFYTRNFILNAMDINDQFLQRFTSLKIIKFSLRHSTGVTNESLKQLVNLTTLFLTNEQRITNDGITGLTNLSTLYACDRISNFGLECISKSLTELNLCRNASINDDVMKMLTNLKTLKLIENLKITDHGLKWMTHLLTLDLTKNHLITNEGIKYLTNINFLTLTLNPNITDEGLKDLTNLKSLSLQANQKITNNGLMRLKKLSSLNLQYNEIISDEGISELVCLTFLALNSRLKSKITKDGLKLLTNLNKLEYSTGPYG